MCACESRTACSVDACTGGVQLRSCSDFAPWNSPHSSKTRAPLDSRRNLEPVTVPAAPRNVSCGVTRSEEHTSDSSHANISYAVFCLKKKKIPQHAEAVGADGDGKETSG